MKPILFKGTFNGMLLSYILESCAVSRAQSIFLRTAVGTDGLTIGTKFDHVKLRWN